MSELTRTPEYLKSVFLRQFNLFDALFGEHIESEMYFGCYCDYAAICGVSDGEWLDSVYDSLRSELISGASTLAEFNILARATEFFPDRFPEGVREILTYRKGAMHKKHEILGSRDGQTVEETVAALEYAAGAGDTDCMALLAFMTHRGYLVKKDTERAHGMLCEVAFWNHTFSLLMCLGYCKGERIFQSILKTVLLGTSQHEAWDYVADYHSLSDVNTDGVAEALEKRFALKLSERDKVNGDMLKVVKSTVITENSKIKLISTLAREIKVDYLPIDIGRRKALKIPTDIVFGRLLEREDELRAILSGLSLFKLRQSLEYRPLLLVCDDGYVLDSYKEALAASFEGCSVIRVDLAGCSDIRFTPTRENPIVNEMNRQGCADAVVLLENCDALDDRQQRELAKFLRINSRKGECMTVGTISLNLTGILPILTASSKVSAELGDECDAVKLAGVKTDEKKNVIRMMVKEKGELFGLSHSALDSAALDILSRYALDEASSLIDKALAFSDKSEGRVVIGESVLSRILPKGNGFEPKSFWGCN